MLKQVLWVGVMEVGSKGGEGKREREGERWRRRKREREREREGEEIERVHILRVITHL